MDESIGRRERKKARTHQAIADAALRLFLERGYDQVSVKEVADAADVAVTTLFKHFSSKESLVFDLDDDLEAGLVAAVRDRAAGQTIPVALREHIEQRVGAVMDAPQAPAFTRMVEQTPELRAYAHRMWTRHETALARAIADDQGAPRDDPRCAALARFVVEAGDFIHGHPEPPAAAEAAFALLERGWEDARRRRLGSVSTEPEEDRRW